MNHCIVKNLFLENKFFYYFLFYHKKDDMNNLNINDEEKN